MAETKRYNRAEGTLKSDIFALASNPSGNASDTYTAQTGRGNIHGVTVIPETDDPLVMADATATVNVNGTLIFTRPLLDLWVRSEADNFLWMLAREGSTIRVEVTDSAGNNYNVTFVFWYNLLTPEEEKEWVDSVIRIS